MTDPGGAFLAPPVARPVRNVRVAYRRDSNENLVQLSEWLAEDTA